MNGENSKGSRAGWQELDWEKKLRYREGEAEGGGWMKGKGLPGEG